MIILGYVDIYIHVACFVRLSVCCARRGVFLLNMVELLPFLFSFVNYHLDEAVVMLSFPPSLFGSRIFALFSATFVIHVLASIDIGLFFILIRFW